ncbi:MAG: HTTM domain-containing protein [Actinomycetota bacterium]|nr:HTTM domain-containing protein [Actinomycetota bacterium]
MDAGVEMTGRGREQLAPLIWRCLDEMSRERRSLLGCALMRIALGLICLSFYVLHYGDRWLLYGPEAVWSWRDFQSALGDGGGFSLYEIAASDAWFTLVFHVGLLVTLLFIVGWRTRLVVPLHWVLTWSLFQRNPVLLDGGDNLLIIVLAYLVAVDCGARMSLDADRQPPDLHRDGASVRAVTLLHNAGLLAIVTQVCILYLTSALYKVQGELWQNGTALYYIMRVEDFTLPGFSELFYRNALFVTAGTYATVLFQLAFGFLLLNRWTRVLAFTGAVAMHGGIAVLMGLVTFSCVMIAVEVPLLGDRRLETIGGWLRRGVQPLRDRVPLRATVRST